MHPAAMGQLLHSSAQAQFLTVHHCPLLKQCSPAGGLRLSRLTQHRACKIQGWLSLIRLR